MAKQEVEFISKKSRFLYSHVFINFTHLVFFVASCFNEKARRSCRGRRGLFARLERSLSHIPDGIRIWFHASSLGEFEQAKPIIEILKQSGYKIIVSFFSPSGYEHSLNYPGADAITYIPFDSPKNARKFISLVKPHVVVIMRYDLWLNHLIAAKEAGAKIIVADATFPMKLFQRAEFLKTFFRQLYRLSDSILTTTSEHKKMFDFFLGSEVSRVAGDTRFDRVYGRSVSNNVAQKIPFTIDKSQRIVMVLGSTWRQDVDVIADGLNRLMGRFPALTVIVVPHEPTSEEVNRLRIQFPNAKVLSEIGNEEDIDFSFVIIDRVGILTQLYTFGDIAYVGGGFGAGVHSVLEPAVYGIPIITGPRIERSDEAIQLMRSGALFFVKDPPSAYRIMLKMVEDEVARKEAGRIAKDFVDQHLGASSSVAGEIMKLCDWK